MYLSDMEIEIIADFLANFYEWEAEDMREEFIGNLIVNEVALSREQMGKIYDLFILIDSEVRYSQDFKHRQFVETYLASL